MNLNAFTHYQTCFRVRDREGKPTLSGLQNILYGWVREKEKDHVIQNEKTDFFRRCEWSNLYQTRSSIQTNRFKSDEFGAWALRFVEQQRDPENQR
ncbi:MAG TPA: hypothetical protein PKX94_03080, partial [Opitutales bacterium]|nr:hypothetical protein [Opitutales bacterium]